MGIRLTLDPAPELTGTGRRRSPAMREVLAACAAAGREPVWVADLVAERVARGEAVGTVRASLSRTLRRLRRTGLVDLAQESDGYPTMTQEEREWHARANGAEENDPCIRRTVMGSIYKPKLKSGQPGRFYWIKYYRAGRPFYESTKSEKETVARRILKAREGAIALGHPFLPRSDRVRWDEAAADLRQHYQTTGSRDLQEADVRLRWLSRWFTGARLAAIGPSDVAAYVAHRQENGLANGTINREVAVLKKPSGSRTSTASSCVSP
jgi:hypothetical protein